MKKISKQKKLLLTAATVLVTSAGMLFMTPVGGMLAQGLNGNTDNPLIQNLAKRFNVAPTEIQKVFEETKDQMLSNKLDQAVKNGKITADQKNLIVQKIKDVKAKMIEINNQKLTQAERKVQMKALLDEVKKWANDNKIPMKFVNMLGGKDMGPKGPKSGPGVAKAMKVM